MKNNTITKKIGELETQPEASNVVDFSATLQGLHETVDPTLIRRRAGMRDRNGHTQMVEYVEWHTVADILDQKAPNWQHEIRDIRSVGDIMTVTVAITIDGVTREGIGTGRATSETGIKKAEHDALKRAAVKFGIARELYKKEFDEIAEAEGGDAAEDPHRVNADPIARTLGDMITAKQLGMIRSIGRNSEIDVDAECREMMHCAVEELSKRAASDLIDHLQTISHRGGTVQPMRRAS
ncbi:MAG: Rad52/Rad22 family DNA repair protein [Pyrinomonadaceae bacterium]